MTDNNTKVHVKEACCPRCGKENLHIPKLLEHNIHHFRCEYCGARWELQECGENTVAQLNEERVCNCSY